MNKEDIKKREEKAIIIESDKFEIEFDVLDDTPGGQSYGRINWNIEPIRKRGKIVHIRVWARQTRDKRVKDKCWKIVCSTPMLDGGHSDDNFFRNMLFMQYCKYHKANIYIASPQDHHSKLCFNNMYSSFSSDIYFE